MICPVCRKAMIVVEQEKIELDYCPRCSGVWFDSGEMELMLERMGLATSSPLGSIAEPEARTVEKPRKCPACRQRMRKATIGKTPLVLIDVCPAGDGLWFDGGEVHQIIAQCLDQPCAAEPSQSRVLTFLGETFKAAKPSG